VIRLAREAFIPYAGDQWYLHRQEDADGAFFWKVAQQGHNRNLDRDSTRQGLYITTADGRLLVSDPFRPSAARFLELLRLGLARWSQAGAGSTGPPALPGTPADPRYRRAAPAGSSVLWVYTRIPLPARADGKWSTNDAVARDTCWITREEAARLVPAAGGKGARQPLPASLAYRLARFHLRDTVRGEAPAWAREEVRELKLETVIDNPRAGTLRLEGLARMIATGSHPRTCDMRIQGQLTWDAATRRLTRFDWLAWGEASGNGPYTQGAPPGKFPLVTAGSLAPLPGAGQPRSSEAAAVPPHGARDPDDYLRAAPLR
jgi:hypothetical protein